MVKTLSFQAPHIYHQYITYLKSRPVQQGVRLEKHRILPGCAGGTYTSSNVVYISYREHILAHFYRYLSFHHKGDLLAYRFMSNQTQEARILKASYGDKVSYEKNKASRKRAFTAEWQKKFGDKNGGKRNVESGFLSKLNAKITSENPELRVKAGKLGGKAVTDKHKADETGMFHKKKYIQKKGNLVRWGVFINNRRVLYKNLSSDFIDYYIEYGNPFN